MSILLLAGCTHSIEVPAPGSEPAVPLPPPEASVISIPVVVDLRPAFSEAEATVPKRFDQLDDWMKIAENPVGDVGAKYEIWRSPLKLGFSGSRLNIEGDVFYRFKVAHQTPLLGWKQVASCGFGEPARVASLRLVTDVSWTSDWRLRSNTTVEPMTFVNRCRVTFLNIDVTDYVRDAFVQQLGTAAKQIDRQLAEGADMSGYVNRTWNELQQPIELAENIWLVMNPTTAAVSPIAGSGSSVASTVNIMARPRVVVGTRPRPGTLTLPMLRTSAPQDGFHVTVDSEISFAEANRRLAETLVGTKHTVAGHRITIRSAQVYGSGNRAVLALGLSGDVNGKVYLLGTPAYDADRRIIYIRSLDYSLETKHAIARAADWLGHDSFRQTIFQEARFPLDDYLATVTEQIDDALNRPLADGVLSRGSVRSIEPAGVYITDNGFVARAVVQGTMRVDVKQ